MVHVHVHTIMYNDGGSKRNIVNSDKTQCLHNTNRVVRESPTKGLINTWKNQIKHKHEESYNYSIMPNIHQLVDKQLKQVSYRIFVCGTSLISIPCILSL